MKRRKPEHSGRSSMGTGTTSLLMIFTVLCFATLALLSLSTAVSHRSIQQRSMEETAAQAAAEGEAALRLAELDTALEAAGSDSWESTARDLGWFPGEEEGHMVYVLPVSRDHELATTVELTQNGAAHYRLVAQVSRYTGHWEPVPEDQLWQGA